MATTRADAEAILIDRIGILFVEVGLDGVSVDGDNNDLNDPIGYALRQLGHSVAVITLVADADMASLDDADIDHFLDVAEYRALLNAWTAHKAVDLKVDVYSESFSQLANRLLDMIKTKRAWIEAEHGLSQLTAGVLTLDFMEKDEI